MNRAKLFYFIIFAAVAALSPFLTLYYESLGLDSAQIGLLTGIVPLVTLFSAALWGAFSDATRRYRAVLMVAIAGLWLTVLALSRAEYLGALIPIVILYAFFGAPVGPIMDSSVVAMLGERGNEYGRVRAWGSIGWGVSAFIMGPILQRAGLDWAFYVYLALMAVVLVVTWTVPIVGVERDASFRAGLRVLARNSRFLFFLAVVFVIGMTQAMVLGFLFLHMQDMGAGETLMSWTLVATVLTEIPLLFLSGTIIRRYGIDRIIVATLLLTSLRAFIFAFMPAPWWVLPANLLLTGPTFAVFWAASVAEANRLAPPGLGATAQGAVSGVMFGLSSAAGSFLGGYMFDAFGAPTLFRTAGWMLVGSLGAFLAFRAMPRSAAPRPAEVSER